jgi:hypothetical protein
MNDDSSTFNVPEYIESRLKPVIPVDFPSRDEIRDIIAYHMPFVRPELIQAVLLYISEKSRDGSITGYSIRDAIQITRFAQKFTDKPSVSIDSVARLILKIHDHHPAANRTSSKVL